MINSLIDIVSFDSPVQSDFGHFMGDVTDRDIHIGDIIYHPFIEFNSIAQSKMMQPITNPIPLKCNEIEMFSIESFKRIDWNAMKLEWRVQISTISSWMFDKRTCWNCFNRVEEEKTSKETNEQDGPIAVER